MLVLKPDLKKYITLRVRWKMHALAPQMCPEDILVDTHVMLYLKPQGQKVSMCLKMIPAKQKHI